MELHLTIKKKWFDLIASEQKIIEYRERKDYWIKRLISNCYVSGAVPEFKVWDEIHFRNGYKKDHPFMRVRYAGITVVDSKNHKPSNGEILKGRYFAIILGEILEIKNWNINETK